uniref:Uncharacterized protein n=1 Tax=Strigamia maritima TaxID=126957 RepID=T1IRT2_STRMM
MEFTRARYCAQILCLQLHDIVMNRTKKKRRFDEGHMTSHEWEGSIRIARNTTVKPPRMGHSADGTLRGWNTPRTGHLCGLPLRTGHFCGQDRGHLVQSRLV